MARPPPDGTMPMSSPSSRIASRTTWALVTIVVGVTAKPVPWLIG